MEWNHVVSYLFGGIFLANAVPHAVSGMTGRAFQSPFAQPPGRGLSSAQVNVLWGFFNLAVAYLLLCRVGEFNIHDLSHFGCAALGALLSSLLAARHFGEFHGGNLR